MFNRSIAVGTLGLSNDSFYLFDKSSSMPLWSYNTGGSVESLAILSDGNYIVAGSNIIT